jgi:hypothetical protein
MWQRQSNAVAVRHASDLCANRQNGPLVVEQDIRNARHGAADAVVSRAFARDNVICGTTHLLVDVVSVLAAKGAPMNVRELLQA